MMQETCPEECCSAVECVINSSSERHAQFARLVALSPARWCASVLLQFVLRRWFLSPLLRLFVRGVPFPLSLCSCVPCANNCSVLQKRNRRSLQAAAPSLVPPSLSVSRLLSRRLTLTATSSARTSTSSSQFVKCGQVQNKGKYLHRCRSPSRPLLPFFLLPPFANASTTPIQPTTSTASCCCCLCGLSDSIRWAAGHGGGRQRFFISQRNVAHFAFPHLQKQL